MKKTILALLLLTAPLVFSYEQSTFDWTPPTERVDGSPLPQSEIASYNIYCNGGLLGNVVNTTSTDTWQSPQGSTPPGDYLCYATTLDTDGLESAPSNTKAFIVEPSAPGAPGGFTVTLP